MNLRLLYGIPEDYPERWERWTRRFRGKGSVKRVKALRIVDGVLVGLFVLLYLLLAFSYLAVSIGFGVAFVICTAMCFCVASLLRRWIDMPRPYEEFDIKPLVQKKKLTKSKSLPSRHAFCAFMIAIMFGIILHSYGGYLVLLLAIALGCIRVLEGVHFPRDIVAGGLLGILAGILCVFSPII